MENQIDLTTCDAFELTEIAHETLSATAGYYYQMYIMEQKKDKASDILIQQYRIEHANVISVLTDCTSALSSETLIMRIEKYAQFSQKLRDFVDGE